MESSPQMEGEMDAMEMDAMSGMEASPEANVESPGMDGSGMGDASPEPGMEGEAGEGDEMADPDEDVQVDFSQDPSK